MNDTLGVAEKITAASKQTPVPTSVQSVLTPGARLPENEAERLAALAEYQIIDTLPEQAYDDIVQLASHICQTPVALIGFIENDRQWFKAKVGVSVAELPREQTICTQTILEPTDLFVIPDALQDERFSDHPLVTGAPYFRFYAATPLMTKEGEALGTLCVFDRKPRVLKPEQASLLKALARQVMSQLELRRSHHLLSKSTETILESEQKHRFVIEAMSEGVLQFERDGTISMCNAAAERILGQSRETILQRRQDNTWRAITEDGQPFDPANPDLPTPKTFRTGKPQSNFVMGVYKPSGELTWVLGNTQPLKHAGETLPYAVVATLTDITALKREESSRRKAEDKLETIFNNTLDFIVLLSPEGNFLNANASALKYVNAAKDDLIGKPLPEVGRRLNLPVWEEQLQAGLQEVREGKFAHFELDHAPPEGQQRFIDVTLKPVFGVTGTLEYIIGEGHDVTERKQTEEQRSLLAFSIDRALEGVALLDNNGVYTYMNPVHANMYGYDSADLMGKTWRELYSPEQLKIIEEEYFPVLQKEGKWRGPLTGRKKSGEPFFVEISLTLLKGLGSSSNSLLCTCRDITQQYQAEHQIRNALREKEVLLKEVYHRVKNNLQITSSLVNLQRDKMPDPNVKQALRESANRIKSMALIHEKLYQSQDLIGVDFKDYISSLVDHLRQAYLNPTSCVTIQTDCDDIQLPLDTAVPCGLIVNELVSNAMKHAFPQGRCGVVRVAAKHLENGSLKLEIADDGVGLPKDINLQQGSSLGLLLVTTLSQQLGGELSVKGSSSGTVFQLVFKEMESETGGNA